MKKPPIPKFIAACPEPKNFHIKTIIVLVLLAAIGFYFYKKHQDATKEN